MVTINASLLQAIGCTAERAVEVAPHIAAACAAYGIDSPQRLAAFLAQVGHESGSFRSTTEKWGPTAAQLTYQGRMGNTEPGDGERYKGHGFLQITGRNNHVRVRGRLRARLGPDVPDFEAEPERLADLQWAAMSAADYWADRGLNAIADSGDFDKLSDLINIGHATSTSGDANGYADRLARLKRAEQAIAAQSVPVVEVPTEKHAAAPAAPAAPVQPPETTMAPFLLPLISAAVQYIPKLGELFGSGSDVSIRNVKAAEMVATTIKNALGAVNEQDAIEKLAADPAAAAAAQAAVQGIWYQLTEVGGGIEAARKANAAYAVPGTAGFWLNPAFAVSMMFFIVVLMLLVDVFYVHPTNYDSNLRVQIVTAILGLLAVVGAYWLGTSASSQRKTELAAGAPPQ